MSAYLIANIEVTDPDGFAAYGRLVAPLVAATGGKYLVRGGALTKVEGDLPLKRLVILEYPSMAALRVRSIRRSYLAWVCVSNRVSRLEEGYASVTPV